MYVCMAAAVWNALAKQNVVVMELFKELSRVLREEHDAEQQLAKAGGQTFAEVLRRLLLLRIVSVLAGRAGVRFPAATDCC